ncbi:uncharacterized protein LOC143450464 isoform X1 [Clavelina lepadiformis]|uniref:uncharacterized protein LOC143450464 isoform X1 n=1 Tax=Clavelina lepadiformis TaxID=159417 RepID=UPI004041D712
MHSTQQFLLKSLVIVFVIMVVGCYARPTGSMEEEESPLHSRRISQHTRTLARKRHAEIRVLQEMAKRMAAYRRLATLNNLLEGIDSSKVVSLETAHGGRGEPSGGAEIYPTAPSHQEINSEIIDQLNGSQLTGGIRMKVIQNEQPSTPPAGKDYLRFIQQTQNAVALAKTCRDMQEMIAKNNLRLRIRCHHSPSSTRHTSRQ